MVDIASAISAYNSVAQGINDRASGGGASSGAVSGATGSDFGSMVQNFAENAVETGKHSEKLTAAASAGQADLNQVVVAVSEAELTLNTVVAVRDKVIQAYQQILRMPI